MQVHTSSSARSPSVFTCAPTGTRTNLLFRASALSPSLDDPSPDRLIALTWKLMPSWPLWRLRPRSAFRLFRDARKELAYIARARLHGIKRQTHVYPHPSSNCAFLPRQFLRQHSLTATLPHCFIDVLVESNTSFLFATTCLTLGTTLISD